MWSAKTVCSYMHKRVLCLITVLLEHSLVLVKGTFDAVLCKGVGGCWGGGEREAVL